uniref:Uncharacterized protein n=1 Tax=Arundo donax TaxID=35708 RepID=A0A0A9B556_ARUDO
MTCWSDTNSGAQAKPACFVSTIPKFHSVS